MSYRITQYNGHKSCTCLSIHYLLTKPGPLHLEFWVSANNVYARSHYLISFKETDKPSHHKSLLLSDHPPNLIRVLFLCGDPGEVCSSLSVCSKNPEHLSIQTVLQLWFCLLQYSCIFRSPSFSLSVNCVIWMYVEQTHSPHCDILICISRVLNNFFLELCIECPRIASFESALCLNFCYPIWHQMSDHLFQIMIIFLWRPRDLFRRPQESSAVQEQGERI